MDIATLHEDEVRPRRLIKLSLPHSDTKFAFDEDMICSPLEFKKIQEKELATENGDAPLKSKIERHKAICEELNALYVRKNHDYGDSFHLSYIEEGMAMPRIRLGDKLNRFKKLSLTPEAATVKDESIRDTLIDLANYAIMTIIEIDSKEE